VKVYLDEAGEQRLVGRADILDDVGAVYEDHLLGASSTIAEHSIFGTIMDRRGRSCLGSAQIVHEAVNCLSLR
jgi:hypothetical protein